MKNSFSQTEIKKLVNKSKKLRINKDLSERIYTSRLLGLEKDLVLHGGGNTSVKSFARDIDGEAHEVIYVKGSGSDLATIEAKDFPAVKLRPLHKLTKKAFVTDEKMVSHLRKNLIDSSSPNPSVETLVHAAIKEKFIDHTHSNAILEITNRKNGFSLCHKIFGKDILVVPYVMPGFLLAKKVDQLYRKSPHIKGIILFKHGIFTFGKSANESYNRMIRYVSKAEKYLKNENSKTLKKIKYKKPAYSPGAIAPIIRGIVSKENKYILNFRTNRNILDIINASTSHKFLAKGVVTPDHVIRIKPKILVINISACLSIKNIEKKISSEVTKYKKNYIKYFKKYNKSSYRNTMLDPVPQIIAIQNMGIYSIGKNLSDAIINGDVAEMAIKTIGNIEKKSSFYSISMKEIFDVEYWSLEQAKLKKQSLPLLGSVTVVTGGSGTIGLATAKKFKQMGSEVIILDINKKKVNDKKITKQFISYLCDIRNRKAFKKVLKDICKHYGGIDFLVSNAGNAIQHEIGTITDHNLLQSFQTNFFAHQIVASESIEVMKKQKMGGCLLFNISKQSVNPGINFGAYGLPKAALLALCKQYALEYGYLGIRANGINADRIESGLLTKAMIKKRAGSRNVSTKEYLRNNLLNEQVLAEDVANAFYSLALAKKTTAAVLTVDGGNIEASMR